MKMRKLFFGVVCALLLTGAWATGLVRDVSAQAGPGTEVVSVLYTFQAPVVERVGDYDHVTLPGASQSLDVAGAPALPVQTARILLPFGARVESVEIVTGDAVILEGAYQVEPAQALIPAYAVSGAATPPDPAIYTANAPFPGALYTLVSVQRLDGYAILLLQLHPVQYAPQAGRLTYYPQLTVNVRVAGGVDKNAPASVIVPGGAARVRALVDNPQAVAPYLAAANAAHEMRPAAVASLVSPADPCDYIIITGQALSSTFQTLADWKTSKGVTARIYTTEAIYAEYSGRDNAEKVRNFIVDAHAAWAATAHPLQYVLLGGDTEVIPIRLVQATSSSDSIMPVDMYYAGLDGNWDADGDGKYGESPSTGGAAGEEIDFFAEVYVGRMPVETATEAGNAIAKTLRYEQNPTADYLDRALWLGQKLDDSTWGGNSKDLISNLAPQYNVTALYARDGTYTTNKVTVTMNSGVHLVNFDGHGNWSCCPLERPQISGLTNEDPFLFYNLGCHTAQFDGSGDEAVAEYYVFTEHGAFAYIGNTRYGWYSPGSTSGPGNELDRLFFNHVINTGNHNVGKALQLAKEEFYPGHRWSLLTLTLLGDPETPVVTELLDPVANISSPMGGKTLKQSVSITGTAMAGDAPGATFAYYVLEYGTGNNPSTWTRLGTTGTVPVSGGQLGVWDTTLVRDNTYTLRLRVSDGTGHTSEHRQILKTDNLYITSPAAGAFVHNDVPLTVTGSVLGTDLQDYVVEYGRGTSPGAWTVITTSNSPVSDGILAVWDTASITEADTYVIRLTRHGTSYNYSERVSVYMDPLWMVGWPQPAATDQRVVAPSIAAGDLDGDGSLDLVASLSLYDLRAYVRAWHSDGRTLASSWSFMQGDWVSAPALVDLDRDRNMEVVLGAYDGQVHVLHPSGEASGWPKSVGGEIYATPAAADLDRDGILEVVAVSLDGAVYAWRYDGELVPGWPKAIGGDVYASPALGDLNGNGDLEVVVARKGAVYAWRSDGTALAGWPLTVTAIVSDVVGSPAIGDINHDGDMEIVLAAGGAVYAWNHDGTAVAGWPKPVGGAVKSSPALGDLDGDDDLEIAVAADQVYVWHHNGTAVAGWPIPLVTPTNSSPVLGDITGDGQPDVIVGAGDKDPHVYAWEGDGSAIPGWPRYVPAMGSTTHYYERLSSPIVVDLDQDGDVEVAIGAESFVFVFDLPAAYDDAAIEWPVFQHDPAFTGAYAAPPNLAPLVREVQAHPGYVPPGGTVAITAWIIDEDGVYSATAEIESPDESVLATLPLYDDGTHGDGAAGDAVFGNTWTTPAVQQDYVIDVTAADTLGAVAFRNNAGNFTAHDAPYVHYKAFTIHYESWRDDGVVTPGEYIQGAITLENSGVLASPGVTVTVSSVDSCIRTYRRTPITFGDIAAGASVSSGDLDFYFSANLDCPSGHVAVFNLAISDRAGHRWNDSFEVAIVDNAGPYMTWGGVTPHYLPAGQPVTITAYLEDGSGIISAQAIIESPDETVVVTVPLSVDDPLHIGSMAFRGVWPTDEVPRTYHVDIVAEDGLHHVSAFDNVDRFTTVPFSPTAKVLLIVEESQGEGSGISSSAAPVAGYYEAALDAIGVSYDLWDPYFYGAINSETLQAYSDGVVIWGISSWGAYLYNDVVQTVMAAYLDGGGRFFISGQNVGQSYGTTSFYADYLHADYVGDLMARYALEGIPGDPIGDGLQLAISGGDGANNQESPEHITPVAPATEVFTYTGETPAIGAIRVDTGAYRVVYFGFGFEAINSAQDRATVMYRVLNWLLGGNVVTPAAAFDVAPSSGFAPLTVAMTGTVVGMIAPYTVTWDFDDGQVQTPAPLVVTHTFTTPGAFSVTLSVQDGITTVSAMRSVVVQAQPANKVRVYLPLVLR
ncbi:MAG: VCBS repeat-containing protein [Anaerolineae bacterium]|nr:VCBS repeat-containing protein [Anaerolineae bacterium]